MMKQNEEIANIRRSKPGNMDIMNSRQWRRRNCIKRNEKIYIYMRSRQREESEMQGETGKWKIWKGRARTGGKTKKEGLQVKTPVWWDYKSKVSREKCILKDTKDVQSKQESRKSFKKFEKTRVEKERKINKRILGNEQNNVLGNWESN